MADSESSHDGPPGADVDARRRHRRRVLKGGAILKGIASSEVKCTIRNMHEHGATLQVDPEAHVPAEFLPYVPVDGVAYRSVMRWRDSSRVGVEITGKEAKPRWHYGQG